MGINLLKHLLERYEEYSTDLLDNAELIAMYGGNINPDNLEITYERMNINLEEDSGRDLVEKLSNHLVLSGKLRELRDLFSLISPDEDGFDEKIYSLLESIDEDVKNTIYRISVYNLKDKP